MKKVFYPIILVSLQICAQVQKDSPQNRFLDRTEFKVNYFGNLLINQGLKTGAEYLWKEKKRRTKRDKIIVQQLLLDGNLGFTLNPNTVTDTGAFIGSGLIYRRTNPKGKQISITINPLGYYRSFLPETFEVVNDQVESVFLPGRGFYAPSLALGFGKFRGNKKLRGRYFNINLMLRTPFNAGTLPFISLEYGYRFKL